MKPVTQNKFGHPHGNCYAACVASIFEVPIETLPQLPEDDAVVIAKYQTDANKEHWDIGNYYDAWWWEMWDAWFKEQGLSRFRMDYKLFDTRYYKQPPGYSILVGESDRGFKHATVALNGKLVHDPHPDRTGLTTMEQFEIITLGKPEHFFFHKGL
jgi:hypothetical protein